MAFPSQQELKRVMAKLKKADPTRIVSKDASLLDRTKFQFCQRFIVYMHDNHLTQVEMAARLGVDKARVNDIVKCKIDLFSLDKLTRFAEKLDIDVKLVAA
jgi:predicted XRE-type DNA-binding protein